MSDRPQAGNELLDRLPDDEFERFAGDLVPFEAQNGDVFAQAGRPYDRVVFPSGGVLSVLCNLRDGQVIETGTVGREGCVGAEVILDPVASGMQTICQVPGTMLVMTQPAFRAAYHACPVFADGIRRSLHDRMVFMSQSIACNQFHTVPERCARWFLTVRDRIQSDEFTLTHEFLAQMLGVHRPTVTLAAGALADAGFIRYIRGRVTIVDRIGLQSVSCECYGTTASR